MSLEIRTVLLCVLMAGFVAGLGVAELHHKSRADAEFRNSNPVKVAP